MPEILKKGKCTGYLGQVTDDFGKASALYDELAGVQQAHYLTLCNFAQPFLKALSRQSSVLALDIGSGSGLGLQGLCEKLQKEHAFTPSWIAFDVSFEMLRRQKQACSVTGNMNDLPFARDSFELIWSNFALHWSLDLPGALQEISRVLSPTGVAVIGIPVKGSLDLLEDIWFDAERLSPLHPMPCIHDVIRSCNEYGEVLAVEETQIPLRFQSAKDCFDWLRQTGVTQKKMASQQLSKTMTKSQYRRIVEALTQALVDSEKETKKKQLQFHMVNIIFNPC